MRAWKAVVYGRVQNVGFRANVRKKALQKGFIGFVRNLSDGGVEIAVVGEKSALEDLLQAMQDASFPWKIDRMTIESFACEPLDGTFEIIL
jgi:acylphosphatase